MVHWYPCALREIINGREEIAGKAHLIVLMCIETIISSSGHNSTFIGLLYRIKKTSQMNYQINLCQVPSKRKERTPHLSKGCWFKMVNCDKRS